MAPSDSIPFFFPNKRFSPRSNNSSPPTHTTVVAMSSDASMQATQMSMVEISAKFMECAKSIEALAAAFVAASDAVDATAGVKEEGGGKKTKTGRKKKDPNAPKRPLSAYLLFCGKERAKVTSSNPEMKGRAVMTELGARWGRLSDEAKTPFKDEAAGLAKTYVKDTDAFNLAKGAEGASGGGSSSSAAAAAAATPNKKKRKKKKDEAVKAEDAAAAAPEESAKNKAATLPPPPPSSSSDESESLD